jgi:3-oxoacyl-[acyl-carrier-protein] synthase II
MNGACGARPLRHLSPDELNVGYGYQVIDDDDAQEKWFRASEWLSACVAAALARSGVDASRERVVAIVGTGLRELRAVERSALESRSFPIERLHFGRAIRDVCPEIQEVITVSNACSAGGHALALAQDLIELGEADAVVVGAADAMTASMVGMIGRFAERTAARVQPFDADRVGVLLGEGAAAVVLVPDRPHRSALARLMSTGLSCDAVHETVPDIGGVRRAIDNAFSRANTTPDQIDVIVAHGTGTALNDPMEASLLREMLATYGHTPLITAAKGAVGHNSGAAALVSLDVALRCLATGRVPPVCGLEHPLREGAGLPFVIGQAVERPVRRAQVNAFGFGGVNAITLIEALG